MISRRFHNSNTLASQRIGSRPSMCARRGGASVGVRIYRFDRSRACAPPRPRRGNQENRLARRDRPRRKFDELENIWVPRGPPGSICVDVGAKSCSHQDVPPVDLGDVDGLAKFCRIAIPHFQNRRVCRFVISFWVSVIGAFPRSEDFHPARAIGLLSDQR